MGDADPRRRRTSRTASGGWTRCSGCKDLLAAYRDLVPCIRIGATDLSGLWGLRRSRDFTVYDLAAVADVIADVVNVFGRADGAPRDQRAGVGVHPRRAGVQAAAARDAVHGGVRRRRRRQARGAAEHAIDGLLREALLDRVNGLHGKTVIHPSHIAPVDAVYAVSHSEHQDALAILTRAAGAGVEGLTVGRADERAQAAPAVGGADAAARRGVRRPARGPHVPRAGAGASVTRAGARRHGRRPAGRGRAGGREALFLLVSKVLGKHIPVPAAACRRGRRSRWGSPPPRSPAAPRGADAAPPCAVRDVAGRRAARQHVIGFAETATGLAHQVAEALDCAWLQNTPRHAGRAGQISFDESHSHARDQWLRALPDAADGPLVIVDDELSTGATAAKLIALLHAPRAALALRARVPGRRAPRARPARGAGRGAGRADRRRRRWGGSGEVELPRAGLERGRAAERAGAAARAGVRDLTPSGLRPRAPRAASAPAGRRSGEFGGVAGPPLPPGSLVLGCGEHLALPQLAALAGGPATLVDLDHAQPGAGLERPGYPLRDGLAFPHPGTRRSPASPTTCIRRRARTSSCTSPSPRTGARPTDCCARWPRRTITAVTLR